MLVVESWNDCWVNILCYCYWKKNKRKKYIYLPSCNIMHFSVWRVHFLVVTLIWLWNGHNVSVQKHTEKSPHTCTCTHTQTNTVSSYIVGTFRVVVKSLRPLTSSSSFSRTWRESDLGCIKLCSLYFYTQNFYWTVLNMKQNSDTSLRMKIKRTVGYRRKSVDLAI